MSTEPGDIINELNEANKKIAELKRKLKKEQKSKQEQYEEMLEDKLNCMQELEKQKSIFERDYKRLEATHYRKCAELEQCMDYIEKFTDQSEVTCLEEALSSVRNDLIEANRQLEEQSEDILKLLKLVGEIKAEVNHTSYHNAIRCILLRYGFNHFDYTSVVKINELKDGSKDEDKQ